MYSKVHLINMIAPKVVVLIVWLQLCAGLTEKAMLAPQEPRVGTSRDNTALALGESRVVGGRNAAPGEFPYIVSLRRILSNAHFCGGSIIRTTWVVTAAHCLETMPVDGFTIVAGAISVDEGGVQFIPVRKIVHQEYNSSNSWRNDISLVQVNNQFIYDQFIQSIPLAIPQQNIPSGVLATTSGWGAIDETKPSECSSMTKQQITQEIMHPNNTLLVPYNVGIAGNQTGWSLGAQLASGAWLTPIYLQTLTVQVVTNEYCQNVYSEHDIPVYNVHLCASNGPEFGVCSGDSGGPLVFGGRLVGIVSWGTTTCAIGYPDAYVRVSEFLDWIRQNALD